MKGTTMIIVAIATMFVILVVLTILYFTKSKNASTASVQPPSQMTTKTEKPVSVASFEEIQDENDTFPVQVQSEEIEPVQEIEPEIRETPMEEISSDEYLNPSTHTTETTLQAYNYEDTHFNEPKRNIYESVEVNYNIMNIEDDDRSDGIDFRFPEKRITEDE